MITQPLYFPQYGRKCPLTIRDTKLPPGQSHLINCDWLSFTALARRNFVDTPKFLLTLEQAEHGTQRFNKLYRVRHIEQLDEVFAEVQAEPRPKFIPPGTVIVKIANRFLYSKELKYYVETLLNELDLTFRYVSRLDLALDFQRFAMRPDMAPHDFFEKIATRSFKMRSHKQVGSPFRDDQDVVSRGRKIRQLTFGSRRSPVYIVMYNKSMEMRQRKFKPYIKQAWDIVNFDTSQDVYRLEFSIKLKEDFIDHQTGEVINKTDLSLLDADNLQRVFRSYYLRHFRVVENDNSRLQRCTPVRLFNLAENAFIQQELSDKKDSHIHTKSQIKRIVKRLGSMNAEEKERMYEGLNYFLSEMVHVHYLHLWFSRKYPQHILPDYRPPETVLGQQILLFKN
ncbi:hypothetical protein [Taibaiella koreensis]|uniref:hypothetical protein n=1 Tax=Taibaiella koreensis TaxID=1268548 RepID=UPI0013C2EAD6|nr:hypothetical protein [Taibaiella koreensis]